MDINYMNILINERKGYFVELKKLIASMNLVRGMDKDQYAPMAEALLQQLEKGSSKEKLNQIIQSQLYAYGLFSYEFDSEKITNEIIHWWENR